MAAILGGLPPDLRKRIEIMADHIARNGPDFEATVKTKNASNPQFAFLFDGEGSAYYQQVLAAHRGTTVAPPAPPAVVEQPRAPAPPAPAVEATPSLANLLRTGQISPAPPEAGGSLANLLRAGQVRGTSNVDLGDILRRWKEPTVMPLTPDVERQLAGVLASLEQMASRDAIRSGRLWIECNTALGPHIAGHIMKRIVFIPTANHRLHVLYLVHDVLQTEAARKESHQPLIRAFKPFLPWILRPCYQLAERASPGGEDGHRVHRLAQLWSERGILTQQEAEEVKEIMQPTDLPGIASVVAPAVVQQPVSQLLPSPLAPGLVPPGIRPLAPAAWSLNVPGVMPAQMMGLPGMPAHQMPALRGYRSEMLQPGVQTPETVPVGVLATMLVQVTRQIKKLDFVRYKPLDPAQTPQQLPPMELPTQRLLERVEDFYEELKDEDRSPSSSSSRSSGSSKKRRRSRSRDGARPPTGFSVMNAVPPPVD